ncbi:MAG: hypothetical protein AAFV33_00350 [Chloroflexota bacterium]
MSQNLLIRVLATVAAVIIMGLSVVYLTQRRKRFGTHTITGIFLLLSSAALLIEAFTLVGEFGLVGGVMLLFAGLASITGQSQDEES